MSELFDHDAIGDEFEIFLKGIAFLQSQHFYQGFLLVCHLLRIECDELLFFRGWEVVDAFIHDLIEELLFCEFVVKELQKGGMD